MTSEERVLAILLNKPELYQTYKILPSIFSSVVYQTIVCEIVKLLNDGGYPDGELVITSLDKSGKLDDAGGAETIRYLANLECDARNYQVYAKQVIEDNKKKRLITATVDLNSYLKSGGDTSKALEEIQKTISSLTETAASGDTEDLASFIPKGLQEIEDRIANPGILGMSLGIEDVDLVTGGIRKGHLWVIGGRPGMGKTQLMCNFVLKSPHKVLFFELEMSKQAILERFLGIKTGLDTMDIERGMLRPEDLKKIKEAIEELKKKEIILDTNSGANLDYVESVIREKVAKSGVEIVIIDHIGWMVDRTADLVHELGEITRRMKVLAEKLNIGIILLTQLNRKVEARDEKRPMMSDIRESGMVEEDSDVIIFLYRHAYYKKDIDNNILEFSIAKHRFGKTGTYNLDYHAPSGRVENFSKNGYKFDD